MKILKSIVGILTLLLLLALSFQAAANPTIVKDTVVKKGTFKSKHPYENTGTKMDVTLYATVVNGNVILAIENASFDTVYVNVKVIMNCAKKNAPATEQETIRTFVVNPSTSRSYDTEKTEMMVQGCTNSQLMNWNIPSWTVKTRPKELKLK